VLGGRYRLIRPLGKGGMGQVYLAEDTTLRGKCAVKELSDELARNPRSRERFVREAKAAAKVLHTNIVQVRDIGTGDRPYLVMEYLEGKSLRQILDGAPGHALPWRRTIAILAEIGAGLQAAHAQNVVHRDIKPGNIMVVGQVAGGDRLKIIDFGIACALDEARITGEAVVGTLGYMAPEQFLTPETVDARADIHAFGTLGLELLMGAPPPSGHAPADAPMDLLALLERCRSHDRDERPPTMTSVIDALDRILSGRAPIEVARERLDGGEPGTVPDDARPRAPRVETQVLDAGVATTRPRAAGPPSATVPAAGTLEIVRPRRWPLYVLLGVGGVGAVAAAIAVAPRFVRSDPSPGEDVAEGRLVPTSSPRREPSAAPESESEPQPESQPQRSPPPVVEPRPQTEPQPEARAPLPAPDCPTAYALAGEWRFTTVPWSASSTPKRRDRDLGDYRLVAERNGCAVVVTVTTVGTAAAAYAESARLSGSRQLEIGVGEEVAFDLDLTGRGSRRDAMTLAIAATSGALTGYFERGGRIGWLEGIRDDPAERSPRVEPGELELQPCRVQCRALCSDDAKASLGTCLAACQGGADATVSTYPCRMPAADPDPLPPPIEIDPATCAVEYVTAANKRFSVRIRMRSEDALRWVEQRCTVEGTQGFVDIAKCVVRCGGDEVFTHTLVRPPPPPPDPAPQPEVAPVVIEPAATCIATVALAGDTGGFEYTWPAAMSKAQCAAELEGGCVAPLAAGVVAPAVATRCAVRWNEEALGERALIASP
jgi:serine/threonine-protein kinase